MTAPFCGRDGDPRQPKTALIAFLLLVVTLVCLMLLFFAIVTDHGPPWWSAISG